MPLYKCKGKDCGFTTDDLGVLLEHHDEHLLSKVQSVLHPTDETRPEPKRHKTAREFVDCPDCRTSLIREFEAAGWKVAKPEPEKAGEKAKRGLFG